VISQLRYIHTYKVISYIQVYASRSWGPTLPPHAAAGGAGAAAVQCRRDKGRRGTLYSEASRNDK
jgi:hypothetical protein